MVQVSDSIPKSTITLNAPIERKYFSKEVIDACFEHPNRAVLLADGHFVDKAYIPMLQKQATAINAKIQVHFCLEERGRNETNSGWSYYYRGRAWASLGAIIGVVPAAASEPVAQIQAVASVAEEPKKKSKKGKKAKQALAA